MAAVQPVGQPDGQPGGEQSGGRAEEREDEVAARPLQPAHRRCQDGLGPPARLLGPQPEGGLDGIGRRQQGKEAHHARQVCVDKAAAATQAGEDVLQVAVALQQVPDAVGDAAEHDADDGQPRGPAGQQAPVQPPGERQRCAQAGCCRGGAGACREQAGADVSPRRHRDGCRGDHGGESGGEHHDPPAIPAVGADPLDPADRRQPRQPGECAARQTAEVATDSQQVGRAEDADGDSPGAAGAVGELRGHASDRGEHPSGGGELGTEGQ